METKEILESFEKFKKQYLKESIKISFDEFDKYFYVEPYFLNKTQPYLEKNFYVNMLQIFAETLKNSLHDLEYYVNLRGNTPLMQADLEIMQDKNKELMKLYLTFHSLYKKHSTFYFEHKENTKEVIEFFYLIIEPVKEYYSFMQKTIPQLVGNLDKKVKELDVKKKKKEFESSAYN